MERIDYIIAGGLAASVTAMVVGANISDPTGMFFGLALVVIVLTAIVVAA